MPRKLNLTYEQQDAICYLIGEWYLEWKSRISVDGGQHRLGLAKEQLKYMICESSLDKEKCKWSGYRAGYNFNINFVIPSCLNHEECLVDDVIFRNKFSCKDTTPYKYCPYCGLEIEEIDNELD